MATRTPSIATPRTLELKQLQVLADSVRERLGQVDAMADSAIAQLKVLQAPVVYLMAQLCAVTGLVHLALVARAPRDLAEGEGAALL